MRSTTNVDLILTSAERGHPTVIFETATNDAACREVLRRLARDLTRVVLPPRPKRGTKRTSLHGGSAIVQGDVCNFSAATLYIRDHHLHTDVSLDLVPVVEAALALSPGTQVKMSITTHLNGDRIA